MSTFFFVLAAAAAAAAAAGKTAGVRWGTRCAEPMRVSFGVISGLEVGVNTSVQHSRTWIEYGDVGIAWVAKQDVKKLTTMME